MPWVVNEFWKCFDSSIALGGGIEYTTHESVETIAQFLEGRGRMLENHIVSFN